MSKENLVTLCRAIKERANSLALKGKKRDEMTLNVFVGAIHGATMANNQALADYFTRIGVLLVASRGYSYVETIIKEAERG